MEGGTKDKERPNCWYTAVYIAVHFFSKKCHSDCKQRISYTFISCNSKVAGDFFTIKKQHYSSCYLTDNRSLIDLCFNYKWRCSH